MMHHDSEYSVKGFRRVLTLKHHQTEAKVCGGSLRWPHEKKMSQKGTDALLCNCKQIQTKGKIHFEEQEESRAGT